MVKDNISLWKISIVRLSLIYLSDKDVLVRYNNIFKQYKTDITYIYLGKYKIYLNYSNKNKFIEYWYKKNIVHNNKMFPAIIYKEGNLLCIEYKKKSKSRYKIIYDIKTFSVIYTIFIYKDLDEDDIIYKSYEYISLTYKKSDIIHIKDNGFDKDVCDQLGVAYKLLYIERQYQHISNILLY